MNDLISRQALYDKCVELEQEALKMVQTADDKIEKLIWNAILVERSAFKFSVVDALPSLSNLSAESEQKKSRKFLGIVVNYPKVCTYPEYEGKPYYSIKYEENGEMIVGYGTYKPEVLSQYLREYFISPTESERKKGEWIFHLDNLFPEESTQECSVCHEEESIKIQNDNFCPNCGADMRGNHE